MEYYDVCTETLTLGLLTDKFPKVLICWILQRMELHDQYTCHHPTFFPTCFEVLVGN